ncbi:MAG TPA: hypothetical protein PLZ51_24080, partial [Aggregatilineales bacterium]|nr:hypothetical protein [Aggregatilineales bacterium]
LAQWYPDDATMQMVLDEIWRKVKDMHTATGQAVTWIAVQQSMIEDLHNQRDLALDYDTTVSEIMADQSHMLLNALEACGCEEEEADMFLQVFCDLPEEMPDAAKELIRKAVEIVYTQEMEALNHVK